MPCISYAHLMPPKKYKEYSRMDLYGLLFERFIADTGKKKNDIEGLFVTATPQCMAEEQLIDYLKLRPKHCAAFDVGGATASFVLKEALFLIEKGWLKNAVLMGTGKFDAISGEAAMLQCAHPDFEFIYGPSIPSFYALFAQKYMHAYNIKEEELALVAAFTRKWANLNPDAFMNDKKLTVDDVLTSPYIATPLRFYDCSIPLSGGGIIFVEKENTVGTPSVKLSGHGEAHGYGYISTNESFLSTSAVHTAKQAFEEAKIKHQEIDVLQIYDAFSICPLILLEDLGFYKEGEAVHFFKEARGGPGGDLPLNTSGGLLSFGHPGMPAGFVPLTEGILQLQGKCGERQVKNAKTALAHCYGGMFANHVTLILQREGEL